MKRYAKTLLASALIAGAGSASAEGTPTLGEVLDASGVEVSGYIDTSYTYNTRGETTNRVFDTEANSFNVNMLGLSISSLPDEGFGGAVVLNAGEDANITAAAGTGSNDEFDVQQAYLNYASGVTQVMFGKFATLQGAEVIESKDNLNFSRSILFGFAIPFTHAGVRASYAASDVLSLTAGINNGWDNLKDDNDNKTLELQATYTPSDSGFLSVQGMYGNEDNGAGKSETRTLIDIVAGYDLSDSLSLTFNADFGGQDKGAAGGSDANWSGYAGYVNYKIDPQWRVAGRLEYFDDEDGFRSGTEQKWKEGTVTVAYTPITSVELRGEVRRDWSDERTFLDDDGSFKKNQTTLAVEALYMF